MKERVQELVAATVQPLPVRLDDPPASLVGAGPPWVLIGASLVAVASGAALMRRRGAGGRERAFRRLMRAMRAEGSTREVRSRAARAGVDALTYVMRGGG